MASIDQPSLPPAPGSDADIRHLEAKSRFWLWVSVISGIVFVGAPLAAVIRTSHAMSGAFASLGNDGLSGGVGDLANRIGEVLVSLMTGLLFTASVFPILILSMVKISKLRSARRLLAQHHLAASTCRGN